MANLCTSCCTVWNVKIPVPSHFHIFHLISPHIFHWGLLTLGTGVLNISNFLKCREDKNKSINAFKKEPDLLPPSQPHWARRTTSAHLCEGLTKTPLICTGIAQVESNALEWIECPGQGGVGRRGRGGGREPSCSKEKSDSGPSSGRWKTRDDLI